MFRVISIVASTVLISDFIFKTNILVVVPSVILLFVDLLMLRGDLILV